MDDCPVQREMRTVHFFGFVRTYVFERKYRSNTVSTAIDYLGAVLLQKVLVISESKPSNKKAQKNICRTLNVISQLNATM